MFVARRLSELRRGGGAVRLSQSSLSASARTAPPPPTTAPAPHTHTPHKHHERRLWLLRHRRRPGDGKRTVLDVLHGCCCIFACSMSSRRLAPGALVLRTAQSPRPSLARATPTSSRVATRRMTDEPRPLRSGAKLRVRNSRPT
eukprot:1050195-Prymnesium_polylepis.1